MPAVVDLACSGVDFPFGRPLNSESTPFSNERPWLWGYAGATPDPVIIMFNPNGSVDSVYFDQWASNGPVWTQITPTQPIYLLVGRLDNMIYPPTDANNPVGADGNMNDSPGSTGQMQNNLWVTINPQTGLVATSDFCPNPPAGYSPVVLSSPPTELQMLQKIYDTRSYARQTDAVGGGH